MRRLLSQYLRFVYLKNVNWYQIRRNLGGLWPQDSVDSSRLLSFIERFRPIHAGWELIRVGAKEDGGYLIPNDLEGITKCISPGVSDVMEFELQIAEQFGIPSLLFDGSIPEAPARHPLIEFKRSYIGSELSEGYTNLKSVLSSLNSHENDLLLQMDIEGHEFNALNSLSKQDLLNFRILVIEFHRIQDWKCFSYFEQIIEPTLNSLYEIFDVVHVHPNNCDGVFYLGKRKLPRALEVTFHNKKRRKVNPKFAKIPHPLDSSNSKEIPDIKLKFE